MGNQSIGYGAQVHGIIENKRVLKCATLPMELSPCGSTINEEVNRASVETMRKKCSCRTSGLFCRAQFRFLPAKIFNKPVLTHAEMRQTKARV